MAVLTREQILAADDLQRESVSCPEWGGEVIVRTLSGPERERFDKAVGDTANQDLVMTTLAAFAICDEKGEPVFTVADLAALAKKSCLPLIRVFKSASRLSGLFRRDELEKKSESIPT